MIVASWRAYLPETGHDHGIQPWAPGRGSAKCPLTPHQPQRSRPEGGFHDRGRFWLHRSQTCPRSWIRRLGPLRGDRHHLVRNRHDVAWVWLFRRELCSGVVPGVFAGFAACPGMGEASVPYGSDVRNRNSGKGSLGGRVCGGRAGGERGAGRAGGGPGAGGAGGGRECRGPGLGPLVVRIAVMYEGAAGAVLLDDMERLAVEESRKNGARALQLTMERRRTQEVDLPRAFRTADLWLIHAADCCSRYSSWTCCGVRY